MRKHSLTFTISHDIISHELRVEDKINTIKAFHSITQCDLHTAKSSVDAIADTLNNMLAAANPKPNTVKTSIIAELDKIDLNDENLDLLRDILQFVQVTNGAKITTHTHDEGKHKCEEPGCDRIVQFWDEPYCFTHSPDSGSSFQNYDARKGGWIK